MVKSKVVQFLFLICCFLSISLLQDAYAGQFFMDCEEALEEKDFSSLKNYFDNHSRDKKPDWGDVCLKLNDSEFLVTVSNIGTNFQGLYYINTKGDRIERVNAAKNVQEEFFGKNRRGYVLLSWSFLRNFGYSYGYSILDLGPRSNGGSFKIYELFYVSEDPHSGLCGEWTSFDGLRTERHQTVKEGKMESVDGYKILYQGTENVQLVFTITEQDCKTLKKRTYAKSFGLVDGVFKLAN